MRLTKFWRRSPRRTVDVDPVQLVFLQFLLRFGAATMDDLYEEARSVRGVPREVFDTAVADAVAQDLVDYRFDPEQGRTSLVLTDLGSRLRNKLPASSRSRLSIYI